MPRGEGPGKDLVSTHLDMHKGCMSPYLDRELINESIDSSEIAGRLAGESSP